MKIAAYDENSTSFLAHSTKQKLNETNYVGPKTATYSDGTAPAAVVDKFFGAVAIPGGAVLVPYSAGVVGLLDANGNYTAGPVAAGAVRYRGGCLTDNGKVIFAPALAPSVGIYDIKTNTFTQSTATIPSQSSFVGCCQMKNGMVLLAPRASDNIGIYNPYTDTYVDGPAHGMGDNAFSGCVNLPNGKVLLVPYDADNIILYDYKTNSIEVGPVVSGSTQFSGAVVLSNGDVVMVPHSRYNIGVYRFATNTVYMKADPLLSFGMKFQGGALTYDGRVVFAPWGQNKVMVYDPATDTITQSAVIPGSSNRFCGAVQLPNGKIALAPHDNTNIGIVDVTAGYASSDALRANMYFNSTI